MDYGLNDIVFFPRESTDGAEVQSAPDGAAGAAARLS